jgi:hypothetical protein
VAPTRPNFGVNLGLARPASHGGLPACGSLGTLRSEPNFLGVPGVGFWDEPVRALVRAVRWSRTDTDGDSHQSRSVSARCHGDGRRLAETCEYAYAPTYKAGVGSSSLPPPTISSHILIAQRRLKKVAPQPEKMKACNTQAADKKGDERKAFMSECLKAGAPAAPMTQ